MANQNKPAGVNIIWANSGTRVDPGEAKANTGWVVETPPYQYENWLEWKQDSFISHINQHGMAVWDNLTEYQGNFSYTKGSNGIIYKCVKTNTNVDPTNAQNSQYWVKAFEDFGAVQVVSNRLDAHLQNYITLAGIGNTAAARVNLNVWSRQEADQRYAALLGNAANTFSIAAATLPEHAVRLDQVAGLLTQATETSLGVVKLSTNTQAANATDDTTAMTPLKVRNVYMAKGFNLGDVPNKPAARANLGLGSVATLNTNQVLQPGFNLGDIPDKAAARANLGISDTAGLPSSYFLRVAANLSDLADKAAARVNLGLTSTATTPLSALMQKGENLAGLPDVGAARNNLGLADTATIGSGNFMFRSNNLADVGNAQAARNNLGLGPAATMSVQGPVASLDFSASKSDIGWMRLPNGMIMQWGQTYVGYDSTAQVGFPMQFPSACVHFGWQLRVDSGYDAVIQASTGLQAFGKLTTSGAEILNGDNKPGLAYWMAIGY